MVAYHGKKTTGDYHDEMNSNHFEEWFHDKLLSNLNNNSLVVMDNALYHSRRIKKFQQAIPERVKCKSG